MTKPTIQQVQRQVSQATDDIKHEAKSFFETAKAQVASEGIGQTRPQIPNPNQYPDTQSLWAEEQKKNEDRIRQLGYLINQISQEENKAREARAQQEQAWQKTQVEAMRKGTEPEEKKGIIATIGRAAKRLKGRLSHTGKGKMEKGRAAAG